MTMAIQSPAICGRRAARWWPRIALMLSHHRERAALVRLGDDALRDLGLTAAQVRREAARPPWEVARGRC